MNNYLASYGYDSELFCFLRHASWRDDNVSQSVMEREAISQSAGLTLEYTKPTTIAWGNKIWHVQSKPNFQETKC